MSHETVTRWTVKCQMSASDPAVTMGWASNEEHLKELVTSLKEKWKYVTPHAYQERKVTIKPETKRKVK